MNELTPIQKEIVLALEQLKEKSLITEAILAKKNTRKRKDSRKKQSGTLSKRFGNLS